MRAQRRRAEQTEEELLKVQNCVLFGRSQQCLQPPTRQHLISPRDTESHPRRCVCSETHTYTGGTHRSYFAPQTGKHMKHTSYTQGHAKTCKAPSSVHTSGNSHTHRRHAQTSHCNIQKHLTCTPRHTQMDTATKRPNSNSKKHTPIHRDTTRHAMLHTGAQLRNTRVHTQVTKFTLQNTQAHIHRHTHIHRDTARCTLCHSQTHTFRTSHTHTETRRRTTANRQMHIKDEPRAALCTHTRAETQKNM